VAFSRLCDEAATRDIAGSAGTTQNCEDLITALVGAPSQMFDSDNSFCGSADLGIGCGSFNDPFTGLAGERVTAPQTTCVADGLGGFCGNDDDDDRPIKVVRPYEH
jgi:hypothetical protein